MWFFSKRQKPNDDLVESEIKAIQEEVSKTIQDTTRSVSTLANEIESREDLKDITLNIFLATGGDRRTVKHDRS